MPKHVPQLLIATIMKIRVSSIFNAFKSSFIRIKLLHNLIFQTLKLLKPNPFQNLCWMLDFQQRYSMMRLWSIRTDSCLICFLSRAHIPATLCIAYNSNVGFCLMPSTHRPNTLHTIKMLFKSVPSNSTLLSRVPITEWAEYFF